MPYCEFVNEFVGFLSVDMAVESVEANCFNEFRICYMHKGCGLLDANFPPAHTGFYYRAGASDLCFYYRARASSSCDTLHFYEECIPFLAN